MGKDQRIVGVDRQSMLYTRYTKHLLKYIDCTAVLVNESLYKIASTRRRSQRPRVHLGFTLFRYSLRVPSSATLHCQLVPRIIFQISEDRAHQILAFTCTTCSCSSSTVTLEVSPRSSVLDRSCEKSLSARVWLVSVEVSQ